MKNFIFTKLNARYAYAGQFLLENMLPIPHSGVTIGSNLTIDFSGGSLTLPTSQALTSPVVTGGLTVTGAITATTANSVVNSIIVKDTPVAVNVTATLTAAQVLTGYITSTSAAAVTMTLPTGTLLGAALGAAQGTIFDLTIDNTAGANTVTVAVAVNGILSAAAVANAGSQGLLTIPSGVTGQACFRLMFSSATAYTFTRIA